MPLPTTDAGGASGTQGTGGAGGGRNDAEYADKVRAAADRRTKAAILAASVPECSFLLCSPQHKGRTRHTAIPSPLTVARSVHTAAAATADALTASPDRESTARELPLADSHLAGGSPELGIHTPGRSRVLVPSEHLPQDRSGRSLLRLHGTGGRAGEPVWDIIGQGDANWGESGGISEAVMNWRMQATGARSQQTERELEMLSSPPRGAWCGAGAARRGGGLMGSPNHQRGADRSTRGQGASGPGSKRHTSLSPSQRSRAGGSSAPPKVEVVEGVVRGIEYKEGLTLSPTELWQVDVTPPDTRTKSYMRNTLATENRRRAHTRWCKRKGDPVNWPWWKQQPLGAGDGEPTIPHTADEPLYDTEGLSGLERRRRHRGKEQRRPSSVPGGGRLAPPLLGVNDLGAAQVLRQRSAPPSPLAADAERGRPAPAAQGAGTAPTSPARSAPGQHAHEDADEHGVRAATSMPLAAGQSAPCVHAGVGALRSSTVDALVRKNKDKNAYVALRSSTVDALVRKTASGQAPLAETKTKTDGPVEEVGEASPAMGGAVQAIYAYACMCRYIYACMSVSVYTHVCVCACVCVYMYIYRYMCIYTHR